MQAYTMVDRYNTKLKKLQDQNKEEASVLLLSLSRMTVAASIYVRVQFRMHCSSLEDKTLPAEDDGVCRMFISRFHDDPSSPRPFLIFLKFLLTWLNITLIPADSGQLTHKLARLGRLLFPFQETGHFRA